MGFTLCIRYTCGRDAGFLTKIRFIDVASQDRPRVLSHAFASCVVGSILYRALCCFHLTNFRKDALQS